jgi:hypothetical protein
MLPMRFNGASILSDGQRVSQRGPFHPAVVQSQATLASVT